MGGPVTAFVGIGANLGDAAATVSSAIARLGSIPQTRLVKSSSLYRTAPHEAQGPDFINAVAELETSLDARTLLAELQSMENEAGRERPYRNAPRTLDLDLLLHGQQRIDTGGLTVPHRRMWERAFVLVPLSEIAPHLVQDEQLDRVGSQAIERLR